MGCRDMAVARATKVVSRYTEPPRPQLRRRLRPFKRKSTVLANIPGTKGIWSELATKLNCGVLSIQRSLRQPGWEFVLEAFEQERIRALDQCIQNVFSIANYSIDDRTRFQANSFILEKLHPEFQPTSRVKVEGEINQNHKHAHIVINIPPEMMTLPVQERLALLDLIDQKEQSLAQYG